MKTKKNFVLRQVAGTWVLLPVGTATNDVLGMVTLNETGVMLWKLLENGATHDELVNAITSEYDVSEGQASADVNEFVDKLKSVQAIEE